MAQAHDLRFQGLISRSHLVAMTAELSSGVTGLTSKSFLPSLLTAVDCFLGPIDVRAVTEVDSAGTPLNITQGVSAVFAGHVAPCAPLVPSQCTV